MGAYKGGGRGGGGEGPNFLGVIGPLFRGGAPDIPALKRNSLAREGIAVAEVGCAR